MVALYRLAEPSPTNTPIAKPSPTNTANVIKDSGKRIFLSDAIFDEIKERAKTVMKIFRFSFFSLRKDIFLEFNK